MNNKNSINPKPPRVFSIWTWFITLLVLGVLAISGLIAGVLFMHKEKNKLAEHLASFESQRASEDLERRKAEEQTKITLAHNRQTEVLRMVAPATNGLTELLNVIPSIHRNLSELMTNDMGKLVASRPERVAQARRLFDDERQALAATEEVAQRLENVLRIERQLLSELGTASSPNAELAEGLQEARVWANAQRQRATLFNARLTDLEREASAAPRTNSSFRDLNLAAALDRLIAHEARMYDEIVTPKVEAARIQATNIVAEAKVENIVKGGQVQAEQVRMQTALQIATKAVETTTVDIQRQRVEDEARKLRLRQKASDPAIQACLASYLSPGIYKAVLHGKMNDRFSTTARPMSLSQMQSAGALDSGMASLRRFIELGMNRYNDRPRVSEMFRFGTWYRDPNAVNHASRLQGLIIELGPTFVEMGLLDP